ncbi:hypothetical protein [Halonatronum saccharophilum]|uniref:hypothetical protein n=1 Tax=Halonatronum saccharophilum TaxID=150060 RepID=UPI000486E2A7|nr:hypothetical protein [Halonatronum saccharophilum]
MTFKFLTLTKEDLLRILASFILGLIIGATILNLSISPYLDELIYQNKELESQVESQETQLNNLEESLAEERRKVIRRVEVQLDSTLDKHINQELKKRILDLLNSLVGRDLDDVDGSLLAQTLNNRIIIIEGKSYKLDLIWIVIQPTSIVNLKVEKKD